MEEERSLNVGVISLAGSAEPCMAFLASLGALALGFLVFFYVPYWRVRRVPGPPPPPFPVGHLPLLSKHGPDIFRLFAKKYGPIFRFHMGRHPLVMVADAELCREVGIKHFKEIRNRSRIIPANGFDILEKGLFLIRDSRWWSTRNLIVSLYQPSHLAGLIPTMQRCVDSLSQAISRFDGGDIPFSELAIRLALDIIGKTAFGIELGLLSDCAAPVSPAADSGSGGDEASAFLKQHAYSVSSLKLDLSGTFSTLLGFIAPPLQRPCREVLKRVPGTADHRLRRANEKLSDRLDGVVAKRSKEMARASKDLLSALLNARETAGIAGNLLTDSSVRALSYEHLVAGTKTTAFTLSMTVYLISQHLEVEKKLLEEIDRFGSPDVVPTSDDLNCKFPYLDQVIKESMRMHTVSPLVARETSQQVEIGGYVLPKGTWVWLAIGVVAKDPKQFPAPEVFRPERFDPRCEEERRRHPYAHIPFGIGPRACIGQKFALQQLKLALIHLYRQYVFRLSPEMKLPLEFDYGLVLSFKQDIKLQAIRRSKN